MISQPAIMLCPPLRHSLHCPQGTRFHALPLLPSHLVSLFVLSHAFPVTFLLPFTSLMPFLLHLPTTTTTSLSEAACSPLLLHALIDPPQNSALSLPLEAGPLTSSSLEPKGCLSGLLSQGFPSTPSTLLQGQHPPFTTFPSTFPSPPLPKVT